MWSTKGKKANGGGFGWEGNEDGEGWLPEEVVERIMELVDVKSLASAGQVCRRWHRVVDNDRLWQVHLDVVAQRRRVIPIIDHQPDVDVDDDNDKSAKALTSRSDARQLMRTLYSARMSFASGIDVFVVGNRTEGMEHAITNSFLALLDPPDQAIHNIRKRAKDNLDSRSKAVQRSYLISIEPSQVTIFFRGLLYRLHFTDWMLAPLRNKDEVPRPKVVLFVFQLGDVGSTTAVLSVTALTTLAASVALHDRVLGREGTVHMVIGLNPVKIGNKATEMEARNGEDENDEEEGMLTSAKRIEEKEKGKDKGKEKVLNLTEDDIEAVMRNEDEDTGRPESIEAICKRRGLKRFDWIDGSLINPAGVTAVKRSVLFGTPLQKEKEKDLERVPLLRGDGGSDGNERVDEEPDLERGEDEEGKGTSDGKKGKETGNGEEQRAVNFEEFGVDPHNEASTAVLDWMKRTTDIKWHGYAQVDWDAETSLISQPKQLLSHIVHKSYAEQQASDDQGAFDIVKSRVNQRQYGSLCFLLLHIIEGIICGLLLPLGFVAVSLTLLLSFWAGLLIAIPKILFRSTCPVLVRPLVLLWALITVVAACIGLVIVAAVAAIGLWAVVPMSIRGGYKYGLWGVLKMTAISIWKECWLQPMGWLTCCWCIG